MAGEFWQDGPRRRSDDGLARSIADWIAKISVVLITSAVVWGAATLTSANAALQSIQANLTSMESSMQRMESGIAGNESRIRAAEITIAQMQGKEKK